MTPNRERDLYSRYPLILMYRPGRGMDRPMHFGVACGDGWFELVDRLLRFVQFHADRGGSQPVVLQIKEKFGSLRVHWRDADDQVRGMTRYAEELSKGICEVCGHAGAGVMNRRGAARTRCVTHAHIANPDGPEQPDEHPRDRRVMTPSASELEIQEPELLDAALLLTVRRGRLSVAALQRAFKIGVARAKRLLAVFAESMITLPSRHPEPPMTHRKIQALKVDADNAARVYESLHSGEGRFGWSYVETADLRALKHRIDNEGYDSLSPDEANCFQPFLLQLNPGDYVVYINMPVWGRCTLAQVTSPYYWEWRDDDFNHRFKVDPATVREFGRNDDFVRPNLKARLKLQNRQWQITAEHEFDELLAYLAGDRSAGPRPAITANLGFLAKDIRPHLAQITEAIQRNHPNYALERLLASVFEAMPRVVDVRLQGGAGDHGADILVTIETGHPLTGEVGQTLCVVQVKSYVNEHWDTQAADDIRRAFEAYPDAGAGLIVSTAARSGPTLEEALTKLRMDTGKPINLLIGEDVALFVLRYGAHLFDSPGSAG